MTHIKYNIHVNMSVKSEAMDAFQILIYRGSHNIARMVYPLIDTVVYIDYDKMFSNMHKLLYSVTDAEAIVIILEKYLATLEFLHEINIYPKTNPLIKLFSLTTDLFYDNYGKHKIFTKLIEILINMGSLINDSQIMLLCLHMDSLGGFKLLDDFGVINSDCTELFLRNLPMSSKKYMNYINIFSKNVVLTGEQINELFFRLIRRYNYERNGICENSECIEKFITFAKEHSYQLMLTDRGFKRILKSNPVHTLKNIFNAVTSINLHKDYETYDENKYQLLAEFGIQAIYLSDTDPDRTEIDSDDFLEAFVPIYYPEKIDLM